MTAVAERKRTVWKKDRVVGVCPVRTSHEMAEVKVVVTVVSQ